MESLIGQTDAMEMVERLNAEFDIVVDQNDIFKKQIETLKEKLKVSESKRENVLNYYPKVKVDSGGVHYGVPLCEQCNNVIYYGEAYSEFSGIRSRVEIYCKDCSGNAIHVQDGWTCKVIEKYD